MSFKPRNPVTREDKNTQREREREIRVFGKNIGCGVWFSGGNGGLGTTNCSSPSSSNGW